MKIKHKKTSFILKQNKSKIAFIINAHAKQVNEYLLEKLINIIPINDLFYSKSLKDSKKILKFILEQKYTHIISGGGDGTFINNINIIKQITHNQHIYNIPKFGVLSLGTGNALATELKTTNPITDIHHIITGKNLFVKNFEMIECNNKIISPFAGLGYDGNVLKNYVKLNKFFKNTYISKISSTLLGYIFSFIFIDNFLQCN